MKSNLIICFALGLLVACSSNKTAEAKASVPEQKPEVTSSPETTQSSADDITGQWKLKLEAYDDNENKILDEDEKKKGIKNNYHYRFNADGSCQIQQMFKGRYEVKTENGSKILYVYRSRIVQEEDKDPAPDGYRIISMSKSELVLLERKNNLAFWVFERVS